MLEDSAYEFTTGPRFRLHLVSLEMRLLAGDLAR